MPSAPKAINDFTGPADPPPFFSAMTAIWQGYLQYEDTVDMKGPVASVEREEVQIVNQNSEWNHRTATLKFDDQDRLIKRMENDPSGTSTATRIFRDGKIRLQTVEHHTANGHDSREQQQWSYDDHGRISDFRTEAEHYFNFKYDAEGRLLGYESDSWYSIEISYAGNTVTIGTFDGNHQKSFEEVRSFDDHKRVIDLKVSEFNAGRRQPWYHVSFRYDGKGRVLEQKTAPYKWGEGDDYSPLPGKLLVRYDDARHSGEQKFYDSDGKLLFHALFRFDHNGIPTRLRRLDASGREVPNAEDVVDPQTHEIRSGKVEWEVIYDNHDNWTERRRWFEPADGSPRILTRIVRQKITYR
jgi:hypothetical protein